MRKISKIALFFVLMTGTMLAFADRGVGKKVKNRVILNISTPANTTFKKALALNLKSGLTYKGSLIAVSKKSNTSAISSNLVTYQKGNTIYIVPFKQKIIVSEIKQGYTGMKLIIKSH